MRFWSWLKKSQERILAYGWRFASYAVYNTIYDNVVYPLALAYFGMVWGWALVATWSLIQCASMYWYYDRSGVDWLLAKATREWERAEGKVGFRRWLARITKLRNQRWGYLALVFANANPFYCVDPLIVAVHFKESHFHGLTWHDWAILLSSVLFANLWWGLRMGLLVEFLKFLGFHF